MRKRSMIFAMVLVMGLMVCPEVRAADITLKSGDVWTASGEVFKHSVSLDNPAHLVGAVQFDVCEYVDGQPSDCMQCTDCELTERTALFDCAVLELTSGCCRIIVFSTHPAGVIKPGMGDIATVVYAPQQSCPEPTCAVQVPENIVASDRNGFLLSAAGTQGAVCFLLADSDGDGIPEDGDHSGITGDNPCAGGETLQCDDNCPDTPNGPEGGTCITGSRVPCMSDSECGLGGVCSMAQEDADGDGVGDVCECGVDGDCDDSLWCNGTERCVDGICRSGADPCEPFFCNEESDTCLSECVTDGDCDDGLWCNGSESCVSGICTLGNPPCNDANFCTTDPCDESGDVCLVKGCAATGPADPCCSQPECGGAFVCDARVVLQPDDVFAVTGGIVKQPVCLDNPYDLVGGLQFDVCEYVDGQTSDCLTCIDCELTGRTTLFDCAVNELANGCCRVILFSTHPGGLINPGICDTATIVYESHESCAEPTCAVQIPKSIVASDEGGVQLPAFGLPGEVCFLPPDADGDGVPDDTDNCPMIPNGPEGGTCITGSRVPCMGDSECGVGGVCSRNQEDTEGDGIGDACACEAAMDCDDALWCNGSERCVSGICVPGNPPCDDANPCTTDPCDEGSDVCFAKGCGAANSADPCCNEPECEGASVCEARVILQVENPPPLSPGEIVEKSVCLDNSLDLVGGLQFDLCEYVDGQPNDCMTCIDCEITERTGLFNCVVNELANGCCRVLLLSTNPGGLINPGLCDIVTVFEFHQDCPLQSCTEQIPENIVVSDEEGFQLPALGLPGEVCFLCTSDEDCDDGVWCNGPESCVDGHCQPGVDPCDDGNDCTDDECDEANQLCSNVCNATSFYDPCCNNPACGEEAICIPQITLNQNDVFYHPNADGGAIVKKPVCLDNPNDLVGGIQFDECEYDINESPIDCMECIACELTERTTMFDCAVLELPNGCCRVLLFCKNPSCAVNPGLCDILTIVFEMFPPSEDCPGTGCEIQIPENIVASDYEGYRLTAKGFPGMVCPFVCGDVCHSDSAITGDCGDGVVDIFDVMCEVDFVLTATTPDSCQLPRADVPTGTPPDCIAPDGKINILDIMVLVDMALNRQDCCSFFYKGLIY